MSNSVGNLSSSVELLHKDFNKGIKQVLKGINSLVDGFEKVASKNEQMVEQMEKSLKKLSKQVDSAGKARVSSYEKEEKALAGLEKAGQSYTKKQAQQTDKLKKEAQERERIARESYEKEAKARAKAARVRSTQTATKSLSAAAKERSRFERAAQKEYREQVRKTNRTLDKQLTKVERLSKKTKQFKNVAKNTGSTLGKVFSVPMMAIVGLNQGIELLQRGLQGFRTMFQTLVSDFVAAGAQAEGFRTRLSQIFGSTAEGNKAMADMVTLATRIPYQLEETLQAATNLAPIMKEGREELKYWMNELIPDLAAVSGLSMQETASNFIKLYSAGAAAADLFRERGINAMLGFIPKASYTARESIKQIKKIVEGGTAVFSGAAEVISATWDGQISMLKDKWWKFRQQVSESGPFDTLKGALRTINAYFDKTIASGKFREWTQQIGTWANKRIVAIIAYLEKLTGGDLEKLMMKVVNTFGEVLSSIGSLLANAFAAMVDTFSVFKELVNDIKRWWDKSTWGKTKEMFWGSDRERFRSDKDFRDELREEDPAKYKKLYAALSKESGKKSELDKSAERMLKVVEGLQKHFDKALDHKEVSSGPGWRNGPERSGAINQMVQDSEWLQNIRYNEGVNDRKLDINREVAAFARLTAEEQKALTKISREIPKQSDKTAEVGKSGVDLIDAQMKRLRAEAMSKKAPVKEGEEDLFQKRLDITLGILRNEKLRYQNALKLQEIKEAELDLENQMAKIGLDGRDLKVEEINQQIDAMKKGASEQMIGKLDTLKEKMIETYDAQLLQKFNDETKDIRHETDALAATEVEAFQKEIATAIRVATEELDAHADATKLVEERVKALREAKRTEVNTDAERKTIDLQKEIEQFGMTDGEKKLDDINREIAEMIELAGTATPEIKEYRAKLQELNKLENPFTKKEGWTAGLQEFHSSLKTNGELMRDTVVEMGTSMRDAMKTSFIDVIKGDFGSLGDVLMDMTNKIIDSMLNAFAEGLANNIMDGMMGSGGSGGFLGSIGDFLFSAHGNAFSNGKVQPYATGGVVDKPTMFGHSSGLGIMGEAGSEAILPLTRVGKDLGVKAVGMGGTQEVEVRIINESGQPMQSTKSHASQDEFGRLVVETWIDAHENNRHGLRDYTS